MIDLTEAIAQAKASGLEVSDNLFRFKALGVGHFVDSYIGPEFRSISITYGGAVEFHDNDPVSPSAPSPKPEVRPSDPAIRGIVKHLLDACRAEGACFWFGSATIGIGCMVTFTPPAAKRVDNIAEDIRQTRIRACDAPGVGHEERLAQLETRANAVAMP